jgi:hypothetical protein
MKEKNQRSIFIDGCPAQNLIFILKLSGHPSIKMSIQAGYKA